jgi:hypothetical protein
MIASHDQLRRSPVLLLRSLFLSRANLAFIICPQKVLNCPQIWSLAVTIAMIFLTVRFSPAMFSSMVRCAAHLGHLNRASSASSLIFVFSVDPNPVPIKYTMPCQQLHDIVIDTPLPLLKGSYILNQPPGPVFGVVPGPFPFHASTASSSNIRN